MAIHLPENQYRGINAHLQSYLQKHGGWAGFHAAHIVHLQETIQSLLSPDSGYIVDTEQSLQISHYDPVDNSEIFNRTRPDISIYRPTGTARLLGGVAAVAIPTARLPVAVTFTEPEYIGSVIIYRVEADELLGAPITRIEVLSPANKPPGSHFYRYSLKRMETLQSGIKLVELDYLHEQRTILDILPSYRRREPSANPYTILVTNPLPDLKEGATDVYGFHVDEPIPTIAVPLEGDDIVPVDFGDVYNRTFKSNRKYGTLIVDYEKLPEGFETYDEEDQRRIKARMEAVAEAQRQP